MPATVVGGWCWVSRGLSNSYSFVFGLKAKWWPFWGPSGFRDKFFFLGTVHIILVSSLPSLVDRTSEHVYAQLKRAEAFNLLSKSD